MSKVEVLNEEELTTVVGGKGKKRNWSCDLGVTAGVVGGSVLALGNPLGGIAGGLTAASSLCF